MFTASVAGNTEMDRWVKLVRLAFVLEAVLVAFQKDVGLFGTGYTLFVYSLYPFPG